MASGRVRTGIRPGTDICRFLGRVGLDLAVSDRFPGYCIGRSQKAVGRCRFSIMVRSGRVGPACAKYPRNLDRVREPVRTDRDFIMWMWMSHMLWKWYIRKYFPLHLYYNYIL